MTKADRISRLKKGVPEAIEAMFTLCEEINRNELTGQDLLDGCRLAIKGGHDRAQIALQMMSWAVGESKGKRKAK